MRNLKNYYGEVAGDQHNVVKRPPGYQDPVIQAVSIGYSKKELRRVPETAVMGMGCGNPVGLAKLRRGQTVLDLGCGGGLDVFLAAAKVGPKGRVFGIDASKKMIKRAQESAAHGNYPNVSFLYAKMEELPFADNSVDVVISNCVFNHGPNQVRTFREALRCLRPGGRLLVSDLVVLGTLGKKLFEDDIWGDWVAHALGREDYLDAIRTAGFKNIVILSESSFNLSEADPRLKGKIGSISIEALKNKPTHK